MNVGALSLSPTLGPFVAGGLNARGGLQAIADGGFRSVQLSAALASMRPRELDRSARRDLLARLRRLELGVSGLDLWIPLEHFEVGEEGSGEAERATEAVLEAIELAADLGGVSLSIEFPVDLDGEIAGLIAERADVCGVGIADFGGGVEIDGRRCFGVGVDPARDLMGDVKPEKSIFRADCLVAARFSDADRAGRVVPGTGRLDVLAYQVALMTAGFGDAVVLDLRSLANPVGAAAEGTRQWLRTGFVGMDGGS